MSQEIFRGPNSPCCKYFSAVSFMVVGDGFIFRTARKTVPPLSSSFSGRCMFSIPSKPLRPAEFRPAGRILFVYMLCLLSVKFRGRKHIGTFAQQLNDRSTQIYPESEIGAG